ncbi:MAG: hypothetical protein CML50_16495 [Rhodobacteraceae bacterium]|jgi:hypothetical protein|nr:hypothetical protein [Paracoccaceae bacterium]
MSSDSSNNDTNSTGSTDSSNNVVYIDLSNNSTKTDNDSETKEELPLFIRVFNNSYIMFLFWFIGIYLVVFVFFGVLLTGPRDEVAEQKMSNTIDILVFISVLVFVVFQLYKRDDWSQDSFVEGTKDFLRDFYGSQLSLFSTMLFILTFYFLLFVMRIPMKAQTKPLSVKFIEFFGLLFLITIFIYDFFKYLLGIDMLDFLGNPTVNKLLNTAGAPLDIQLEKPDQVFNVSNNYYTYDDARAVCKAFDARLATYDEIEKAYDHGAEWCNYGWSEGQMAYFPTQKSTWKKLQESELNKNSCGRPGINGGYFANPHIKFGVNCFGKKPKPTDLEKNMMEAQQETPIPKTEEEIALDEKVKYYKENGDQLLQLNSFNKDKWSRY